jgi:hypothetical protein
MPFPIDQQWIEAAEQSLGRVLPQAYRAAMTMNNGGSVVALDDDWELHPIFDQSEQKRIKRTANHIIRESGVMREWAGWPADALSIATNGAGDRLVLLPAENGYDEAVYAWDHETGETFLIADDFSELEQA